MAPPTKKGTQSGGAHIAGSVGSIGGDIVGGNKIVFDLHDGGREREVERIYRALLDDLRELHTNLKALSALTLESLNPQVDQFGYFRGVAQSSIERIGVTGRSLFEAKRPISQLGDTTTRQQLDTIGNKIEAITTQNLLGIAVMMAGGAILDEVVQLHEQLRQKVRDLP